MEAVSGHALRDRRRLSRVSAQMECWFTYDNKEYEALLLDLSQEGAFLASTFLPDLQSKVIITLEADCLEAPLTIKGTVTRSVKNVNKAPMMFQAAISRGAGTTSEHGDVYQFGVEFENPSQEILRVISSLSADRRRLSRISTQMECRFISDGKEYEAIILDLSREGAFLASTFLPEQQSGIFIHIEAESLQQAPLTLKGTVTRNTTFAHGKMCQFGVEFKNPPTGLLRLISALFPKRIK